LICLARKLERSYPRFKACAWVLESGGLFGW
jgi:hypothetical protein